MANGQEPMEGQKKPFRVPPEKTGLTPAEEAYVPRAESRPVPRGVFTLLIALLLAAFAGGGILYYHTAVRPERLYQAATRFFEEGDYAEALPLYRRVLRSRPERRDTLFQIARCQEALGRDAEAAVSYARHAENQPRDLEAHLRLGSVYLRMGQFESALPTFERAAKLAPSNAEARYALGKIYEHLDSPSRAADNYERAVKGEEGDVELLLSASKSLMNRRRYEAALVGYEKAAGLAASGDKRAMHGATAARNMLGWPTDPALTLIPGKSLGKVALGADGAEVAAILGEPETKERGEGDGRESWGYGGELTVLFAGGRVAEIRTSSSKYRSPTGLGLANFLEPKYADRFDRWAASDAERPARRYILKGGGLVFYESRGSRAAVVCRGEFPPTDRVPSLWRRIEENP